MTKTSAIEQRACSALTDTTVTSAMLHAIINDVDHAIGQAEQQAVAEKERALDPTQSPDPKKARQAIEDAAFAANRLRTLLTKLLARYQEVHDQEQATAWLAEYDVMKRERDALAEELGEVYPEAANKIMDLFIRITANNNVLSELHQARPAGVIEHLVSAELHARELDRFTRDVPSLVTSVCLFDWNSGRQIWPQRSIAAAFAATFVPANNPADWANNHEQRAAARQRERQYMADFYVRQTQQQEERQNAEARDRFAEGQRKNST